LGRIDIKTNAFKPAVKFGEEEGGGVEYVEGDVFNDTAGETDREGGNSLWSATRAFRTNHISRDHRRTGQSLRGSSW
jgi:hypothetical protein